MDRISSFELEITLHGIKGNNELYDTTYKLYKRHETKEQRYNFMSDIKRMVEATEKREEDLSCIVNFYISQLKQYDIPIPECLRTDNNEELSNKMRFMIGVYVGHFKDNYTLKEAP